MILHGDIWSLQGPTDFVIIPTNAGWKRYEDAVMGAGLALEAARRFPEIVSWYGQICRSRATYGPGLVLFEVGRLVLFPTKPLDRDAPHLSWKNEASLPLIDQGLRELQGLLVNEIIPGRVLVPLVGAGLGGLDVEQIRERLAVCESDRFVRVEPV